MLRLCVSELRLVARLVVVPLVQRPVLKKCILKNKLISYATRHHRHTATARLRPDIHPRAAAAAAAVDRRPLTADR